MWGDNDNNNNNNNTNNNNNKIIIIIYQLKIFIALFPDVIKSTLQKFHIKLNTILNGEKLKNKI